MNYYVFFSNGDLVGVRSSQQLAYELKMATANAEFIVRSPQDFDIEFIYYNNGLQVKDKYALTTDATDTTDPYDGVPDIVGDASSSCTIDINKTDWLDTPVTYQEDTPVTEDVVIETTNGSLPVEAITLSNGVGAFTLTSSTETVLATVTVSKADDNKVLGTIQIQFT